MKAGLITFHRADNYGAVLQASALLKYINKNICSCELIDYLPNNTGIPSNSGVMKVLRYCKRSCMYFTEHKKSVKKIRFERFRKKNYILSQNTYYGDDMIEKNPPEYDVLISGSDQILNLTLSGDSVSYYLAFAQNTKKVSYASSFGRQDISEEENQAIKEYLVDFAALSVRERSAIDLLKEHIDKDVKNVVDPVFLMDKEEWAGITDKKCMTEQKYIFVYAMENTEVVRNLVREVSEKYRLPVIKLSGGCNMDGIIGTEDKMCGPERFLAYIKNAEIVITNSFHGISFSHIFEKKFYAIAHTKRNTRIEDLMSISGNRNKIITDVEKDNVSKFIDGAEAFQKLQENIEKSKRYLKENIAL